MFSVKKDFYGVITHLGFYVIIRISKRSKWALFNYVKHEWRICSQNRFTNSEVIDKQIKKTNIRTYYLFFFEVGNKRLVALLVLHVPIFDTDRIPLGD